jgi:uncharacterized protein YdeI (YjbR/CyaY-like superfamily)
VWLVYAKKGSGLPSLSYNDAVEEALCVGWIDSRINPIDEAFYMQVFTPRQPRSGWSALNKARVARLVAAGLMKPAGLAAVTAAKASGAWDASSHVEDLTIPPDLKHALRTNPDARRGWAGYSPSRRKAVLFRLAGARRPETRARYLHELIGHMAARLPRAALLEKAGFRPKAKPSRRR